MQGNVIPAEASCKCALVVRFGSSNREIHAYLTADYGHDNPGTLVDLAIAGGVLVVSRTNVFAPGTYTQSGVVTEMTELGQAPLENATVSRVNEEGSGWQDGTTDKNGFYEIHGLYDGSREVAVWKEGYETREKRRGDPRRYTIRYPTRPALSRVCPATSRLVRASNVHHSMCRHPVSYTRRRLMQRPAIRGAVGAIASFAASPATDAHAQRRWRSRLRGRYR